VIRKSRSTRETQIELALEIEGRGKGEIETGIGFFDHMLESLTRHSGIDLSLKCRGDLHVDFHHTVEDVGILLGTAFHDALFPLEGRERFGDALIVMDEAALQCALDLSNRPFLLYRVDLHGKIGEFDGELVEEFFRAFVFNARITCHITMIEGRNRHHIAEAAFKALAVALRRAMAKSRVEGVPSTKGLI